MDNNNAENRGQLDRILELERALARQQRRQQLSRYVGRLHTVLTHAWSWRQWQRTLSIRNETTSVANKVRRKPTMQAQHFIQYHNRYSRSLVLLLTLLLTCHHPQRRWAIGQQRLVYRQCKRKLDRG